MSPVRLGGGGGQEGRSKDVGVQGGSFSDSLRVCVGRSGGCADRGQSTLTGREGQAWTRGRCWMEVGVSLENNQSPGHASGKLYGLGSQI